MNRDVNVNMKQQICGGVIGIQKKKYVELSHRLKQSGIAIQLKYFATLEKYLSSDSETIRFLIISPRIHEDPNLGVLDIALPVILLVDEDETPPVLTELIICQSVDELFRVMQGMTIPVHQEPVSSTQTNKTRNVSHSNLIDKDHTGLNPECHHNLLDAILENTPDIVAYTDSNFRLAYMNRAGMKFLGIKSYEELKEFSFDVFIAPPDLQEVFQKALQQAKNTGTWTGKLHLVTRSARLFPTSMLIIYHKSSSGADFFSFVARDHSEVEKQQNQFIPIQQLYETLAEATQQMVTVISPKGELLYINQAVSRMAEQDVSDWIGSNILDKLFQIAPQFHANITQVLNTKENIYTEEMVRIQDKNQRLGTWMVPMLEENGDVRSIMSVSRDITSEQESQISLIHALEKERAYHELQSRFISMVSHEFKTPLSTILSSVEILQTYAEQLSPEKKNIHTKRIEDAVITMNHLLEDILAIGRISDREVGLRLQWFDPVEFCEKLVEDTIWNDKIDHPVKFVVSGTNNQVYLDPYLLRQILQNVLSNAIKYSDIGTKIVFTLAQVSNQILFTITDEGIGIPKDEISKVYDPFFRASNHQQKPGTGLGLTIAKNAVTLLNGSIEIQSEISKGTRVTITLPITIGSN